MNKTQFIAAVAEKSELTKKDADKAVNAMIEVITDTLKAGDKVQIMGFGNFEVKERAERAGINPATKQPITIAASKSPVFKAGKALKDSIK
ncbi:HU family DNA-binding protein [Christensenella sp. MSJ-20]|uniref:HU family DNA-binding protein n=1 Tax=Christensenella sp. MSJ-20 TaxID=2841518 RepID=UPI001C784311|nr:HU family DNA-binding protein [Christensenella sp. MSJ-20]